MILRISIFSFSISKRPSWAIAIQSAGFCDDLILPTSQENLIECQPWNTCFDLPEFETRSGLGLECIPIPECDGPPLSEIHPGAGGGGGCVIMELSERCAAC